MLKIVQNGRIRVLIGAVLMTVLVVSFIFRERILSPAHPLLPSTEIPPLPEFAADRANGTTANSKKTDVLSGAEAQKLCGDRRFEVFKQGAKPRKIYDLIMVNTEIEWLEIRLKQYYDSVDYFVIVEASITFQGNDKPLYVKDSWDRFAPYHSKMILHTLNIENQTFADTWNREILARNAGLQQVIPFLTGNQKAELNDVLLVSDIDELLRPDILTMLRNCDFHRETTFVSDMYYYSFQWANRGEWPHPHATYYEGPDKTIKPDSLRSTRTRMVYQAGWHCSSCFSTMKEMVDKVKSFSHHEFNRPDTRDPKTILQRVRNGIDFFDRKDSLFDRVENNLDIPDVFAANRERYSWILNRDPANGNFRDYKV